MFTAIKELLTKWFHPKTGSVPTKDVKTISADLASQDGELATLKQIGEVDREYTLTDLVPYDENLLERSGSQWQFGDWDSLAALNRETLQHHPDRAKLALLAAAGRMQKNQMSEARQLIQQAQDWGVSRKSVTQILASGVHNSLACASYLAGQHDRASQHFESSVIIGAPSSDGRLMAHARKSEQLQKLNLAQVVPHKTISSGQNTKDDPIPLEIDKISIDTENKKKIKDYLNKAAELKTEEKYLEAESELQKLLKLDPSHNIALRELGKINSLQKNWEQATEVYDQLLKSQKVSIDAVLKKCNALRNLDKLEQMIALLEGAKAIGLFSTQLEHQLAIAYRDTQQLSSLESQIDEIIKNDPDYSMQINFASFAADALRKQGRVRDAYELLLAAVNREKKNKIEVPLISKALLEELEKNYENNSIKTLEVSKNFYDNIYSESEHYRDDSSKSIYLPVWKLAVDYVERFGAKVVLDIGCGPGQFAEYLFSRLPDINYKGIDFSETAINQAKLRCSKGDFSVQNITEKDALMNINAEIYIVLEVLEHVDLDREIISSIQFNKNIIFSVPNFDSFGHVRFFRDEKQIKERYNFLFKNIEIITIHLKERANIYLCSGVRNDNLN